MVPVSSAVFPSFIYHAGAHHPEMQVLFLTTQGPHLVPEQKLGIRLLATHLLGWDRKLSVFVQGEEKEPEVLVSLSASKGRAEGTEENLHSSNPAAALEIVL